MRVPLCIGVFLIALVPPAVAVSLPPVAEDLLQFVPEEALAFAVVRDPDGLDVKIQAIVKRMQLAVPGLLALCREKLGIREGLDAKRATGVLVLPPPAGQKFPLVILLIPMTDYDKLLEPFKPIHRAAGLAKIEVLGIPAFARKIGRFAAIADLSGDEALGKILALTPKRSAQMGPWQDWLADKDLAVVVLPRGVKHFSLQGQESLQLLKSSASSGSYLAGVLGSRLDLLFQFLGTAEKEVATAGLGVQLDREGVIRIVGRAMLVSGGEWSRLAADPVAKEDPLAFLPAGPFAIAAAIRSQRGIEALNKVFLQMTRSMYRGLGLSEEQIEKGGQSVRESIKGVGSWAMVRGGDPQKSDYSGPLAVMRVHDSKAYMAEYEKKYRHYAEAMKSVQNATLRLAELEKTQIDGKPAFQFRMKSPQSPSASTDESTSRTTPRFFGPQGDVLGWAVAADDRHVIVGYVSEEYVRRAMDTIRQGKRGLTSSPAVAKTAALLPQSAPAVMYISPSGVIASLMGATRGDASSDSPWAALIAGLAQAPPIGAALTGTPAELWAHVVFPAELSSAVAPHLLNSQSPGRGH